MPAVVHARQVTDDTLVVQLAGNWQLQRGVPELTEIQPQLNDTSRIRQLTFEVLDMLAWDTGLLTFLLQLLDYCHQHQIVVDQSGLPEGVRRLLALATAVPEREGARRGATRLSWLAQVGTATMEFLVLPRMLALMLMMPLLCVFADIVGMLAGLVVATGLLDMTL